MATKEDLNAAYYHDLRNNIRDGSDLEPLTDEQKLAILSQADNAPGAISESESNSVPTAKDSSEPVKNPFWPSKDEIDAGRKGLDEARQLLDKKPPPTTI